MPRWLVWNVDGLGRELFHEVPGNSRAWLVFGAWFGMWMEFDGPLAIVSLCHCVIVPLRVTAIGLLGNPRSKNR